MNNFENVLKFCSLEIFIINKCVEFTLTCFGILKYDCIIKTIEMFNFLLLINKTQLLLNLVFYFQSYQQ